jgi:hypothetical protein
MQNIAQTLEPSRNLIKRPKGNIPRTMHKFDAKQTQSLDSNKQVQCRSCQAWGHKGRCFIMCEILNINEWIKENPKEAEKQRTLFAQTNGKRMVDLLQVDNEESHSTKEQRTCTRHSAMNRKRKTMHQRQQCARCKRQPIGKKQQQQTASRLSKEHCTRSTLSRDALTQA